MKKILIIEDDPAISMGLQDLLHEEHYEVISEDDGERGYKKALKENVDLIILDIMLPLLNGFEVCKRLKSDESTRYIPIIMLTAKNLVQDLVHGFESGANDYLVKPFTKDELLARVWSQLKLKAAYQTLRENLSLRNEL